MAAKAERRRPDQEQAAIAARADLSRLDGEADEILAGPERAQIAFGRSDAVRDPGQRVDAEHLGVAPRIAGKTRRGGISLGDEPGFWRLGEALPREDAAGQGRFIAWERGDEGKRGLGSVNLGGG